ncbi:MAG: endolytic transglycosylase MltG [Candidatus Aminicenantes bacterium]|nr:endolytic transglycosylase MltG [Candidatus Aminicenantes bacterium]
MIRKIIKSGFAVASVALFASLVWLSVSLYRPRSFDAAKARIEIEKGMGAGAVARLLKERGIIGARLPFIVSYRLFFHPQSIKAGEYVLTSPLPMKEILGLLVKGRVHLHPVTIPEGLTAREIAPLVASVLADGEDGFMTAVLDPGPILALDPAAENLEGYLFPETYSFPKNMSSSDAVQAMVGQFRTVFEGARAGRSDVPGMNVRQTVTMASLVEKETSLEEEKRLVSAVFHNRLRIGMKLDCDPTIIYALKQKGLFTGNLTKKDLALDSPYNTYKHAGLPPGPICNPGKKALEAALHPAPVESLYFVSRNDGSHHFSRTYAEHLNAVRRYQKRR